jgi:hypothetical protein
MKLDDKVTQSVAATVSDVLEGKVKKEEVKYPHKMYSKDGKDEVEVKDKAEHDKFAAKGYVHEKPKMESPEEPRAQGEKEFKAKHAVKKSGEKEDGTVVKEMTITLDEAKLKAGRGKAKVDIDHTGEGIPAAAKKYKLKFKKHSNGFDVSGEKKNILAYLQSKEYDMDSDDIEELFPELMEAVKKEGNAFTKALMAAKKNGDDTFVVAGKKYKVEDYDKDEDDEEEVDEARSKFPKSLLKKASDIALSMGGNMTGAVKKIEKLKKGLSDDPEIKAALQLANEEFVSEAESKKEKYQKVFQAALKKFGVKSPGELEGAKKKEFFDYVDKNYDAGENETD